MKLKQKAYKFENLTHYPVVYSQLKNNVENCAEQLCNTQLSSLVLCMSMSTVLVCRSESTEALVITHCTTLHGVV